MSETPPTPESDQPIQYAAYPRPGFGQQTSEAPRTVQIDAIATGWRLLSGDLLTWVGGFLLIIAASILLALPMIAIIFMMQGFGPDGQFEPQSITAAIVMYGFQTLITALQLTLLCSFTMMGVQKLRWGYGGLGELFKFNGAFPSVFGLMMIYSVVAQFILPMGLYAAIGSSGNDFGVLMGGAAAIYGVWILAYVFLIPLLIFCGVAAIDQRLGTFAALSRGWQALSGQYLMFVGVNLASFVLSLIGALACCVGILVSAPLYETTLASIYHDFFRPPATQEAAAVPPGMHV